MDAGAAAHGAQFAPPGRRPSGLAQLAPQRTVVYILHGQKYTSLEELQAALRSGGYQQLGQAAAAAPPPAGAAPQDPRERVRALLADEPRLRGLVRTLFSQYSGADRALQHHEFEGLMGSLTAQLGVQNPGQVVGQARLLFYAFDFDGSGTLEEAECERLVSWALRTVCGGMAERQAVGALPHRVLSTEFEIKRRLGQGGMGVVHLATHRQSGCERVVKQFAKSALSTEAAGVQEEFETMRKLDHPSIARVFDIFQDATNFYVVSEPFFGGDLTTLLPKAVEQGVMPTMDWFGRVFRQCAAGLAYLHSKSVMHCDLKEPNVMVAKSSDWHNPQIVIIDFGMARDFGGIVGGGTPGYMPPEVWQMQLWTPKGDVFSLAILFWSVLNCRQGGPFLIQDAPPYARIRARTISEPVDFGKFPPVLKEEAEKMASKDLRQRPSAAAVSKISYFQGLDRGSGAQGPAVDAAAVAALRERASSGSRQRELQTAVALKLTSTENLAQLTQLNELFRQMDLDNDGSVTADEAQQALAKTGMAAEQRQSLIDALVGEGGAVRYSEFMAKLLAAQKGSSEAELARAFAAIDTDGSGSLERHEVEALLRDPTVAGLFQGRPVADIFREMDTNGDGRIDFEEFRRAMLEDPNRQSWQKGDAVRYFSRTHNTWLQCRITDIDATTGSVMIDVKPGYWFKPAEQKESLLRGAQTWSRGEPCRFYDMAQRVFIDTRIAQTDPANPAVLMVEARPGVWVNASHVSKTTGALAASPPGAAAAQPVAAQGSPAAARPAMVQRASTGVAVPVQPAPGDAARRPSWSTAGTGLGSAAAWAVGQPARYFSERQQAELHCRIARVDPGSGAVMLDIKPNYWMPLEEQRRVLRRDGQ